MNTLGKKLFFLKSLFFELRSFYSLRISGYLFQVGWFRSFKEKKSVDNEGNVIPWLPYPVIDFLTRRLNKNMSVFEYGCGASTIWLSSIVKNVISCEHNKEWYENIKQSLPENSEVLYRNVENNEYSKEILNYSKQFDIIFVDGCDRINCIKNSLNALKEDGIIILDDSFREEYNEAVNFLFEKDFRRIEISGPTPIYCNYNETSIFYRNKNIFNI